jgi:3-hexulose-6-phosphate synthase
MKIQVAIDRVTVEEALSLIQECTEADIIELGTSLSKDYGLESLRRIREAFPNHTLLADIKTIDEGKYEFTQYYDNDADILTVMGASTKETIQVCWETAQAFKKEMMIDLLECSDEKIEEINSFDNAIYCLHFSVDADKDYSVKDVVTQFKERHPSVKRIAIAGGMNKERIEELKGLDVEIAVVGSAVTKSDHPKETLSKIKGVI